MIIQSSKSSLTFLFSSHPIPKPSANPVSSALKICLNSNFSLLHHYCHVSLHHLHPDYRRASQLILPLPHCTPLSKQKARVILIEQNDNVALLCSRPTDYFPLIQSKRHRKGLLQGPHLALGNGNISCFINFHSLPCSSHPCPTAL